MYARDRVRIKSVPLGDSRTKQSFKKDCDINVILAQFIKGRQVSHLAKYGGAYGDVPAISFHEAMNIVATAQEMFSDVPATVRARFSNDPGMFFAFARDPKNIEELRRMKLAPPAPAVAVSPVTARVAELEVEAAARLELARRAIVAPPAPHTGPT